MHIRICYMHMHLGSGARLEEGVGGGGGDGGRGGRERSRNIHLMCCHTSRPDEQLAWEAPGMYPISYMSGNPDLLVFYCVLFESPVSYPVSLARFFFRFFLLFFPPPTLLLQPLELDTCI